MSWQFIAESLLRLNPSLERRLAGLRDREALMQQILDYLLKSHQRRLRMQYTVDNQRMRPRKVKTWNGQAKPKGMFQGLRRRLQTERSQDAVQLGYNNTRYRAARARWHNEGSRGSDDLKKRPQREFLGISGANQRVIDKMIKQHLSS